MNIFLWVLQILLSLHTIEGALWKYSNPEQTADLRAIPHGVWLTMAVIELFLGAALLLPAVRRSWGVLAPIAATCIAGEMILLCGVYTVSGNIDASHPVYWLVVAAICAFIAYSRFSLRPISR